jgi:hypothetical protein
MISIAGGGEVQRLLDRVALQAGLYRQVIVCSPYMDEPMCSRLAQLAARIDRERSHLSIITRPDTITNTVEAQHLRTEGRIRVTGLPGLHAKFYLAVGRDARLTEAILTSANCTLAGTTGNIELGIRMAMSTPAAARLIEDIDRFARRIVA